MLAVVLFISLHTQYFQLDSFCLVDKALSLCSFTFVRLRMVDYDVKHFHCDR